MKRNWAAITNGGILSFLHENNCCLLSKGKKHNVRTADVLRQSIETTICNKTRNTIKFDGLSDCRILVTLCISESVTGAWSKEWKQKVSRELLRVKWKVRPLD